MFGLWRVWEGKQGGLPGGGGTGWLLPGQRDVTSTSLQYPLYNFTHSIRFIREWFWAISNTLLGPPTSMIPRARTTQKPVSITTTWNTSVQTTAFMPPCKT